MVALEAKGHVLLHTRIELSEDAAKRFNEADKKVGGKLTWTLRQVLLEGRTGFNVSGRRQKEVIDIVTLDQRIVIDPENPAQLQRLLDGIQELVTLRVRAMGVLKQGVTPNTSPQPASKGDKPPEHMYG